MRNRVSIQNGRTGKQDSRDELRDMYDNLGFSGNSAVSAVPLYQINRINPAPAKLLGKQNIPLAEREIVKGKKIRDVVQAPVFPLQGLLDLLGKITLRGCLLSLLALAAIALSVILMVFNLKKTVIYGNTKYSQEQIESFITRGRLGDNTFVMALKYHHRTVTDIPFIDQIDIDLVNASTVRVNIKEKEIAASIFHNGRNVYISRDGMIQTVSGRTAENTTMITGVTLTNPVMGEQIQAENQKGMSLALELLSALDKYGIHADSIDIDEKNSLTASFGNVKVRAGKGGYDQKMFKLHQIVPYLEGRSGIISMTGYNYNGENIVLYPFIRPEVTRAEAAVEAVKANGDEKVEQVKPAAQEEEEESKTEKAGKAEKAEKAEKAGEAGKAEKAEKAGKAEEAEKAGKTEKTEKVEKAEKSGDAGKAEEAEKTEKIEKSETGKQEMKEETGSAKASGEKAATENKAAAEKKAAAENKAAAEKTAAAENKAAVEKKAAAGNKAAEKETPAAEKKAAAEKAASEKQAVPEKKAGE